MVQHTIIAADNGKDNITVYTKEPGVVTSAHRSDLNALRQLPEAQKAGIYILIGENKRYIGQAATSVYSRLYQHDKEKDWWNQVIFFGREDGHLDKSQLDYLETVLIKEFRDAGFNLENATQGNSSWIDKISKIHADNIWHITQNVLEEVANIPLFEPSTNEQEKDNVTDHHRDYTLVLADGSIISGKNPTTCYVNLFKHLLKDPKTKDQILSLVTTGGPSSRLLLGTVERFDKSGMRLTSPITPHIHVYSNLSTADKKRVLRRFANQIGLSLTINWD
ncbi:GIY-YIG nuclease family protein [Streptococcus cuniculipharyngis]|uniref:GIY-YIG nuclease family protein n=1 Tax=Streptococcus cuniculipharyngis TaxID=1562651 RepID=A0A5C5SD02_9STRE|nr:GIY-YIG nuclease family protein [Streptococcus cuniculipharyngis]TWS97664.1 GIY-YIG nuclease family protein [Streptococcus cuniculipharyngis]